MQSPSRIWTPQQDAVYDFVANGAGHGLVQARAGAGKTSTIIEALARARPGTRVLLVAFGKEIARALQLLAPRHVKVNTLHSLGYSALRRAWPELRDLDEKKDRRLLELLLGAKHKRAARELSVVVSLCKARMVVDLDGVERVVHRQAVYEKGMTERALAEVALAAMEAACEPDAYCSYDDMVFVPVVTGLRAGEYDLIFVDETQDMSRAQLELAQNALAPGGRLVLVGDSRQAIFAWRGADSGGMDRMRAALDAQELGLTTTFRCGHAITKLAAEVVPDFEAAPTNPPGEVVTCDVELAAWRVGDAVISRTNAPLVKLALRALRTGVRARIQGRDLAKGLAAWVRAIPADSPRDLLRAVERWRATKLANLVGDEDPESIDQINDRVATLRALADGAVTVDDVIARLESLFVDKGEALVFSTTHRAKGLEWDRVFLMAETFRPTRGIEEENIWYVAVTRAKQTLTLCTGAGSLQDERVNAAVDAARAAPATRVPTAIGAA